MSPMGSRSPCRTIKQTNFLYVSFFIYINMSPTFYSLFLSFSLSLSLRSLRSLSFSLFSLSFRTSSMSAQHPCPAA